VRIDRRIASRYSQALLEASADQTAQVAQQLAQVQQAIGAVPDLVALLNHPEIPVERKQALLDTLFAGQVSPRVLAFLKILVAHARISALEVITQEFRELALEAAGQAEARVTSAVALTPAERERLAAALSRLTGRQVRLLPQTDPALLAGVSVRIGDRVIDGSARAKLQMLRAQLRAD